MALCQSRSRKKVLVFTIMSCGLVWLAMLSVGFTCCVVVSPDTPAADTVLVLRQQRYGAVASKRLLYDTSWQLHPEEQGLMDRHTPYQLNSHLSSQLNSQPRIIYGANIPKQGHLHTNTNHDRTKESSHNVRSSNKDNHLGKSSIGATKKLPQAIIIGVKKGGTRALLEFLRIHPDVRAPGPETHFFDRYYHKGLQWYREQMPATLAGQMTVEKTPSYLITKEVPRRVYSMSRDIKLVVVLRDPVTRAISDYTQAASKRPGMKPFEQMAFLSNYTGLVNTSWGAVRIGVYAKHVDRWLKYFPLRQIHFVSGEKLITDPAGEMAKVQDFLELKRVITDKNFYYSETKKFPCVVRTEGNRRPHCLGKSKGRQHPAVSEQVLSRLRDFYRPFNAKLYQMIGQDFGWS